MHIVTGQSFGFIFAKHCLKHGAPSEKINDIMQEFKRQQTCNNNNNNNINNKH
jgi:hypothetical protein